MIVQKSAHQYQVEAFMLRARQRVPVVPTEPTEDERLRMARVMLEEVLETITHGLGVRVHFTADRHQHVKSLRMEIDGDFNMIETIDGCMDTHVVTTCIMAGCGLPEQPFQDAVNENNLQKFVDGHSFREDGKLFKPVDHPPPDIAGILRRLKA